MEFIIEIIRIYKAYKNLIIKPEKTNKYLLSYWDDYNKTNREFKDSLKK